MKNISADLSDFQEYKQGWDGFDAIPLEKDTLKNFKQLLKNCPDDLLDGWHIEPKANGTLVLVAEGGSVVINIGNITMSYFIDKDGDISGSDPVEFSVDKTLDILKRWRNSCRRSGGQSDKAPHPTQTHQHRAKGIGDSGRVDRGSIPDAGGTYNAAALSSGPRR